MAERIEGRARELVEAPNTAYIATLREDGSPHTLPVWIDLDDHVVQVNSSRGRAWLAHLERDPRIAITVPDRDNPYEYVNIRGTAVELTEDAAVDHIDALAQKYIGQDRYPWLQPGEVRVKIRVELDSVVHKTA